MSDSHETHQLKINKIFHADDLTKPDGESQTEQEIIAGEDDRLDYYKVNDAVKKIADATVILTGKDSVVQQSDGSFELQVQPFRRQNPSTGQLLPPCSGERFSNQHTGGWCSGFMVGEDIIVTAGHCGETEEEIKSTAYIFGFRVGDSDDPGTTKFSVDQVYFGKELIAHDLSSAGDFAIVRVDRKITATNAVPVKVRSSGSADIGDNVGVVGYPSGLPVKIAFGAETQVRRKNDPWLVCNLDTYGGNSGSPVFNADGTIVEGILVRGARDYNINDTDQCFVSNVVANSQGSEAVMKSETFVDKIPDSN